MGLGWRLDADIVVGDNFRVVQLTPPALRVLDLVGEGPDRAAPGSAQRLLLAVSDIDDRDLIKHGADVSEVFHLAGGRVPGRDPQGRASQTYASFNDPDGNEWLLQEIATRLPAGCWPAFMTMGGPGEMSSLVSGSGSTYYRSSTLPPVGTQNLSLP